MTYTAAGDMHTGCRLQAICIWSHLSFGHANPDRSARERRKFTYRCVGSALEVLGLAGVREARDLGLVV